MQIHTQRPGNVLVCGAKPKLQAVVHVSQAKRRRVESAGLLDGILGTFKSEKTHAPGETQ